MSDEIAITCIACGKACNLNPDGLCPRCVADSVPQVGAVDWSYREPSRVQTAHRDSPIVLGGELCWQQDQAPHVPGSAYRSDPGHRTVSREISEREAARVLAQRAADALQGLTDKQADALTGKARGLSYAEQARAEGTSPDAVRKRAARARLRAARVPR